MIEDLRFWLEQIVEDDPIPYEIKHIIFYYVCDNAITLCMGGTEQKPTQNNMFDYFPLEAQYFNCKELNTIKDEDYFQRLLKSSLDECFSSGYLKNQFKDKKIYICNSTILPKYIFCL